MSKAEERASEITKEMLKLMKEFKVVFNILEDEGSEFIGTTAIVLGIYNAKEKMSINSKIGGLVLCDGLTARLTNERKSSLSEMLADLASN